MALKSGICELMLCSLFLLGNACCRLNSDVLKSTIMNRAYNYINYTFGRENCWNVNRKIDYVIGGMLVL